MEKTFQILPLLDIGFLPVRIWDVLDVFIFGYLLYRLFKLLKGSIAFNIFVGVMSLYVIWWLVRALKMDLLSQLFDQFVSVGVIILIIIFQPEVRRFLLLLGNTTLRQRSNFLGRLFDKNFEGTNLLQDQILDIKTALLGMSKGKIGALVVLTKSLDLEQVRNTGVPVNASISQQLLRSIFNKDSPLHDGAVLIGKGKILAASCILPVSESTSLPKSAGLRHRAAVGISERTNVVTFVVSEETGSISFSHEGTLQRRLSEARLTELLNEHYG